MFILHFLRALINVLQLASKTGTILCGAFGSNKSSFHHYISSSYIIEIGNNAAAASVLTSAAKVPHIWPSSKFARY